MTYISIIKFLAYCNIEVTDAASLSISRVKKQVNAEFGLAENGIITIDHTTYNKQDVLNILEASNCTEIINYQLLIEQYPALKHFLETGEALSEINTDIAQLSDNEGFVTYISPYFAQLFNKEMRQRLQNYAFKEAADWTPNCRLVLLSDGEAAFSSTSGFLNENIKLFKNLNHVSFNSRIEEVIPWTGDWAEFMNQQPDILYAQKEELSNVLIDFCIEIQNEDPKTCYLISEQMTKLNFLDGVTTKVIHDNHEIYEAAIANASWVSKEIKKKHRTNNGYGKMIRLVIFIAILIRIISNCNKESSRTTSFDSIHFNNAPNISISDLQSIKDKTLANLSIYSTLNDVRRGTPNSVADTNKKATGTLSTLTYLSFLTNNNTDSLYTVRISNQSNTTYVIYIPTDKDFMDILLESGKDLTINRQNKHIDFFLFPQYVEFEKMELEANAFDKFYWTGNGNTEINNNNQYTSNGFLSLNDPNAQNVLTCTISPTQYGTNQITSDDLFIVKETRKTVSTLPDSLKTQRPMVNPFTLSE